MGMGMLPAETAGHATAGVVGWVAPLWREIDDALKSDKWALLDTGDPIVVHRYYSAAALRHCAVLLCEMDRAVSAGLDMTVRIVERAHLEAFLTAMYLYFGGPPAVERVVNDGYKELLTLRRSAVDFDWRLRRSKRETEEKRDRLSKANRLNEDWNNAHPDQPARPMLPLPHVPQLPPAGRAVRARLRLACRARQGAKRQGLSLEHIVAELTKLATAGNFGKESFEPLYLHYRTLSTIGSHPGVGVYDGYLTRSAPGGFIRVKEKQGGDILMQALVSALWSTSFLATRVLGDVGSDVTIARAIADVLEAQPGAQRGWFPGR
jgi:hypothetical protein